MADVEDVQQTKRVHKNFMKKFQWRKVTGPRVWRPKDGDEIFGFYAGQTAKKGQFGEYTVILVRVPEVGTLTMSGTHIVQLVDSALITVGAPVHITFKGYKDLDSTRSMKLFDLEVGDVNPAELLLEKLEGMMAE